MQQQSLLLLRRRLPRKQGAKLRPTEFCLRLGLQVLTTLLFLIIIIIQHREEQAEEEEDARTTAEEEVEGCGGVKVRVQGEEEVVEERLEGEPVFRLYCSAIQEVFLLRFLLCLCLSEEAEEVRALAEEEEEEA